MLSFHQPSPAMFNLLDRTFLMAKGRCLFSGAPGSAEEYFARQGLPVPHHASLAEHMLDCASDVAAIRKLLAAAESRGAQAAEQVRTAL